MTWTMILWFSQILPPVITSLKAHFHDYQQLKTMEGFNLTIILFSLLILFSSMDFKHKIIQWNCRVLKPNYNEVSLLISEYNPSVFCFQTR